MRKSLRSNGLPSCKKNMISTRSFGHNVTSYHELEMSLATHAARLATKLRRHGQLATSVAAYIRTSSHIPKEKRFSAVIYETLSAPSNNTSELIEAALRSLDKSYQEGFSYKKSGVWTGGLVPETARQVSLLRPLNDEQLQKQQQIDKALDKLNEKYGPKTLIIASEGVITKESWAAKREKVSPVNPKRWSGLPVVRAK